MRLFIFSLLLCLFLAVIELGFIAPTLISANDTFLVVAGIFSLPATVAVIYFIVNFTHKSQQRDYVRYKPQKKHCYIID